MHDRVPGSLADSRLESMFDPVSDALSDAVYDASASRPAAIHCMPEKTRSESSADGSLPPGMASACCKTMIRHGVNGCNPHHPTLRALLQAGAAEEEFVQAARSAAVRGKTSFAYVIGTVKRQREEAAKLVLHQGRMPNPQELLEASNKTATEGWLPPELRETGTREAGMREPEWREIQHANR